MFARMNAMDAGLVKGVAVGAALAILIGAAARIQVPMLPVPMTLQSLAVLLVGLFCGVRMAGSVMAAYLAGGFAGLPFFASGAGPAYLLSPTAGYLFGFAMAAVLAAWIVRTLPRTPVTGLVAAAAGSLVIYVIGIPWLAMFIGTQKAIEAGLVPFLLGDAVKAAMTATIWWLARLPR